MNDYAQRQRTSARRWVTLCAVVVLHALLLWAIQSGLAQRFVKVVKGPVQAMLLEEVQPVLPPPPPPPPVKPPPAAVPPPPTYVPPVVVPVNAQPPANAIAAVSNKPQPEAVPSAVPVAVVAQPPAPLVRTAAVIAAANCEKPEYPSASRRFEEEGTVTLKFLVGTDGKVKESALEKSSGFKRLDDAARLGLAKCLFKPGTENGHAVESWASIKYTWKLE